MFKALRVFEYRDPVTEEYQVPSIDVVSDISSGTIVYLPAAPVIVRCTSLGLRWEEVPGATEYLVENMVSGALWTPLITVAMPTPVQIVWDGYEWLIQSFVGNSWVTEYQSYGDTPTANYTPDEAPGWEVVGSDIGTGSSPIISQSDPVAEGGIYVEGAGTSLVNQYYALAGNRNGFNYYLGPSVVQYNFIPSVGVLYRVRAVNGAGNGPASNVAITSQPLAPSIHYVGSINEFNAFIPKSQVSANPSAWQFSIFYGAYTPKTQAQISSGGVIGPCGPSASEGQNWGIYTAPSGNWFYVQYQIGGVWSPWSLPCIYP